MSFDQGQFNFDAAGDEAGYRDWQRRLDEQRHALESRWGIVLGKRVRIQLADHAKPLEGTITLAESPAPGTEPRLRLAGLEFLPHEVTSLARLAPPEVPPA